MGNGKYETKERAVERNPQIMAHEDFMEDMEINNPLLHILTDIRIKKIIQQIGYWNQIDQLKDCDLFSVYGRLRIRLKLRYFEIKVKFKQSYFKCFAFFFWSIFNNLIL